MATVPTILQIPSGYKSGYYGVVYNVLPQNNSRVFYYQKSGNATRVNKDGIIETNGSNLPRLDYTNSTCPSLLLEPQRTNYLLYSEDFSQWNTLKGNGSVTETPNNSVSPDGTNTATRLQINSTDYALKSTATSSVIGDYSASVFLKSNTGSNQQVAIYGRNTSVNVFTVTNDWKRFEIQGFTSTGQSAYINIGVNIGLNSDSSLDISVWGGQLEEGLFASSYIPTNGSAVTRNLDSCYSTTLTNEMNGSKSSFFIDVLAFKGDSTISLTSGNTTGIALNFDPVVGRIVIYGSGLLNFISVDFSQRIKIGISFEDNNFKVYYNGVLSAIDTSVTYPTNLNYIKFSDNVNANKFEGNLYDLRFYNNVILTEAELIELTTI